MIYFIVVVVNENRCYLFIKHGLVYSILNYTFSSGQQYYLNAETELVEQRFKITLFNRVKKH